MISPLNSRKLIQSWIWCSVVMFGMLLGCTDAAEVLPKIYSGEVQGWKYQLDVRRVDLTSPDEKDRTQLLSLKLRFEGIRLSIGETGTGLGGIQLNNHPGLFYPRGNGGEWVEYLGPRPGPDAVGCQYVLALSNHGPPIGRAVLEHTYQPSELPLEIRDPGD